MNRIWAPWRKVYIRPDQSKKQKGCLFCRLQSEKRKDAKHYVLKRTPHSFAVLNLYPYNNGHVLIVPARHVGRLDQLNQKEKLDWLELYEEVQSVIEKTMKAQGFNVGLNLGQAAGAGIPKHLHLHLVPRWTGDSNFMSIVAEAKIISESLGSTYRLLAGMLSSKKKQRLGKRRG